MGLSEYFLSNEKPFTQKSHKLVNLDKKEVVDPEKIGFSAKQYEHSGTRGSLADAMYLLVMTCPNMGSGDWPLTEMSGRWAGDRVVILGSYTTDSHLKVENVEELYEISEEWTDLSAEVRNAFSDIYNVEYTYGPYGHGMRWQQVWKS